MLAENKEKEIKLKKALEKMVISMEEIKNLMKTEYPNESKGVVWIESKNKEYSVAYDPSGTRIWYDTEEGKKYLIQITERTN